MTIDIAFIGGTTTFSAQEMKNGEVLSVATPYGNPSAEIIVGEIVHKRCAFLPRHGIGHTVSPTRVNSRANIYALKSLGVVNIISISAVGSLKENIKPLDLVIPNQLFDRTKFRPNTFFDDIVVHVGIANPFCGNISDVLYGAAKSVGASVTKGGTYVCIEGPQFSTRAESFAYKHLGFDVIGMTGIPEAQLAREAEVCYGMLATVTDYDVWRGEEVSTEIILENVIKNEETTKRVIEKAIEKFPIVDEGCLCRNALQNAIVTNLDLIPDEVKHKLHAIIGKYV